MLKTTLSIDSAYRHNFQRALLSPALLLLGVLMVLISTGCNRAPNKTPENDARKYLSSMDAGDLRFNIQKANLLRNDESLILTVTANIRNNSNEPFEVNEANVRLYDGTGRNFPMYFEAFSEAPKVMPGELSSGVPIRYNIQTSDLKHEIFIQIGNKRKLVKDATPIDDTRLPSPLNGTKTFNDPDWQSFNSVVLDQGAK